MKLFEAGLTAVSFLERRNFPRGGGEGAQEAFALGGERLSRCGNKSGCKINGSNTPGAPRRAAPLPAVLLRARKSRSARRISRRGIAYRSHSSRLIMPRRISLSQPDPAQFLSEYRSMSNSRACPPYAIVYDPCMLSGNVIRGRRKDFYPRTCVRELSYLHRSA